MPHVTLKWALFTAVLALFLACNSNKQEAGELENNSTMKCGDATTYKPSDKKNAFRLRVHGKCPVKFTVECSEGTNPTPGTIAPDKSALVNCDPGKNVKTVELACQAAEKQKCEFSYEVVDIQ